MTNKKLVKSAGYVAVITIIGKFMGFLKNTFQGRAFGTTGATDAYTVSLNIPTILYSIIGVAVSTAFIPLLNESYAEKGKEDMFEFANNVMNILFLLSTVIFIIAWVMTPLLVKIMASHFTGEKFALTVYLTKISIVNLLFLSMSAGFTAILQIMNDFTAPALNGILIDIPPIIFTLFFVKYGGIVGLTIFTTIAFGLQVVNQIPWLLKNKYRYSFKLNLKDPRIFKMLKLISPVIIGLSVNQINIIINTRLASGLPNGNITAFSYASLLNGAFYSTFATSVVTVIFPTLSKEGSIGDIKGLKNHIVKAINNINMIMIPLSLGIMVLRYHIIDILFKHGKFNEYSVEITSVALLFLSIGMVFYGIRDVFNISFYSTKDTKTPMINSIIGITANILISIILVKYMGIAGIAIGSSVSAAICAVLLMKDFKKKMGSIGGREMLITAIKLIMASSIMCVIIILLNRYLGNLMVGFKSELLYTMLIVLIGSLIYMILLYILKVKEFNYIYNTAAYKIKQTIGMLDI
ncbi:murein biosynthesis integral membrane protein MurJ [Aceticella autotrophica]|uniref:Probable lipid II flippase MurJ n=1 Tax=Aceticella autotrophica TaxID=2755338 RepID=A0A975AUX0_9THEO|nr:murein biosynthesis integral membrane protein MurJ [Aceticella autotrophica]QSZ26911.1 murein biosynthesis integral membrane protein MurJ [Aceticella autotrophica]